MAKKQETPQPEQNVVVAVEFELAQIRKFDKALVEQPIKRRYFFTLSQEEADKPYLVSNTFKLVAVNKREVELKLEYEKNGTEYHLQDADWYVDVVSWSVKEKQVFKPF